MPDNANHTTGFTANGGPQLPLQPFFTALQQNGFSVTPEQTVQASRLIDRFSPEVANEAELCNYLSPLFARNEEEQLQFAEIFTAQFKSPAPVPLTWLEKGKRHLAKYRLWYALIFGLTVTAVLLAVWYVHRKPATLSRDAIQFYIKEIHSDTSKIGYTGFHMTTDSLLSVRIDTSTAGSISGIRLQTRYQWGDGTATDTVPAHRYSSEGNFTFSAYSTVFYNNRFQFIDTSTALVGVCSSYNTVQITAAGNKNTFITGEKIHLQALITGEKPDRILWGENEDTIGYGNTFDTSYSSEGSHTIGCGAVYDSINSPCNASNSFSFTISDPNKPVYTATIAPAANAQPITLLYRVKPVWYKGLGIVALLAFIGAMAVAMRSNNRKHKQQQAAKKTDAEYDALLQSFTGKKKPAELPFRSKNYLPVPEPELAEAAVQMRRRVYGGAFYLDIPKTIDRAIRQGGFFQPVHSLRLHQNEYLVLIDASHNNNQQVKLFDYLTEGLRKQNVFIEKYYYRYEPKQCFSATEPDGISLEKLAEKYSRHTLLIFGNAYQLLYPYYPVFDSTYSQLLSRWENKAVITPVPLPDWTDKEKAALLPNLPVLPVDVAGLLELMPILFGNEGNNVLAALQQHYSSFYGTASIDFEDITALEKYCNAIPWANTIENSRPVNILFQWIAALTVYPRLRWEVTLAIGKAILDRYGKPEELNFTTLLRVARIQWMKDGRFPDETRLELLKRLTPENEVLARQTVLALLEEIPIDELDEQHFAWQEKEIQRITNEFILYAYDPLTYASYKRSEELYGKLLAEKKIKDVVSRLYLKNGPTERWPTLLSKGNGTGRQQNIPLAEYFSMADEVHPDNTTIIEKWSMRTGIFITFLSVVGLVFLFVLDLLHTNRFSAFMWKPPVESDIRYSINATNTTGYGSVQLNVDGSYYTIPVNDSLTGKILLDDTAKRVTAQFDGQQVLDTTIGIQYKSYSISLIGTPRPVDTSKPNLQTVADKPVIYIQYNNKNRDALASRNTLIHCLEASFSFPGMQYKPASRTFNRNEIRYYNARYADSGKLVSELKACLKAVYPDKVFYPVLINGGKSAKLANGEIWIYDTLNTTYDSLTDEAHKYILSSGDSLMAGGVRIIVGPFVQNSKGEKFFLCIGSALPSVGTLVRTIESGVEVGWLAAQSSLFARTGLIKVNEANVKLNYPQISLKVADTVSVGRDVWLYNLKEYPYTIRNNRMSWVRETGATVTVTSNGENYKISGAIVTTGSALPGAEGSLLMISSYTATGVLAGRYSDGGYLVFIPIAAVLKEFGVVLGNFSGTRSPSKAN